MSIWFREVFIFTKQTSCGTRPSSRSHGALAAFTRLELMIVLGCMGLLLAMGLPALAGKTSSRSQRIACLNNLRQIGQAFRMWADDHEDRLPWLVPGARGGTGYPTIPGQPSPPNAWAHFQVLSNELSHPRLLLCPSDDAKARRVQARNWGNAFLSGYGGTGFQDSVTSYIVGLHASEIFPQRLLSADRNIVGSDGSGVSGSQSCGLMAGIPVFYGFNSGEFQSIKWGLTDLHLGEGNFLIGDGSVQQHSTPSLQRFLRDTSFDLNDSNHYLFPQPYP